MGADRLLYGVLEAPHPETKVIAELPSLVTTPIDTGQRYDFYVPRASLRYFDPETGRRLDIA